MQPFGVNVVFVLFQCELNTYKVQLYVNERLTQLPGCAASTCTFSEFSNVLAPIVATCDLDAICENPPNYYNANVYEDKWKVKKIEMDSDFKNFVF